MKVKTSELIGPALDWAVAKCEGINFEESNFAENGWNAIDVFLAARVGGHHRYSTEWAEGGPIVEREGIPLFVNRIVGTTESGAEVDERDGWTAYRTGCYWQTQAAYFGPTPLIAAMRCYVASKLGDEVDVPEELLK